MLQDRLDYTFQTPVFEGPLDVLLRLIERHELDITSIALAQVADQYLAHVRALIAPDPAALSSFLVIAAKLLLIKSRALLPRPSTQRVDDGGIDEGEELVRQLREYQRFKQAAEVLRGWQESGLRTYVRQSAPPLPEIPEKIDATLGDMMAAIQRRLRLVSTEEQPVVAVPTPKIITVPEMAARIETHLREQVWIDFEDLLSTMTSRVEIVVALWTVLELLKRRAIVVDQQELFGRITIGRGPQLGAAPVHALVVDSPEA